MIRVPSPSTFHSREDYYHSLYHEMIHASGHPSRLDREEVTRQARFGSERYSKEELVAELGAAFLSNEAGILDSMRFENSATYLGSWINKLENDPRMIVSAASQAQKASDFVLGIEHKESLQECQTSPERMPLTWAREHGIDTRIPGFVHQDQDVDRSFNPHGMEARHTANRPAFPTAGALAMKGIFLNTLAHPRLDFARLHPSRRRVLAAPGDGTNANQLTFPDPLGFARPFAPSSPRPIARLRAGRIGGWTFGTVRQTHRTTRTFPDLTDQARISDVIQDSDFRTEIASRKKASFSAVSPCVRRTTRDFATSHRSHLRQPNT